MHEIIITVEGGVIQSIDNIPPGVTIKVQDFDTEGSTEDEITESENGETYVESVYGPD